MWQSLRVPVAHDEPPPIHFEAISEAASSTGFTDRQDHEASPSATMHVMAADETVHGGMFFKDMFAQEATPETRARTPLFPSCPDLIPSPGRALLAMPEKGASSGPALCQWPHHEFFS